MSLKAYGRKVSVIATKPEEVSSGGLIIPDTAQKSTDAGIVTSVGSEVQEDISVGDKVLFTPYAGSEVEHEGETYIVLADTEIIAVVSE